jgi:transcriptional regulator with XRE-family HTH domain
MLRKARERMGLTLRDVEAVTGLRSGGISHLENGRSVPSLMTALTLCRFYGLSLLKLAAAVAKDEL